MLCFLEISSSLFPFEYDIETFYTTIHANRERFIKGVAHDLNDRNPAVIRKTGDPKNSKDGAIVHSNNRNIQRSLKGSYIQSLMNRSKPQMAFKTLKYQKDGEHLLMKA